MLNKAKFLLYRDRKALVLTVISIFIVLFCLKIKAVEAEPPFLAMNDLGPIALAQENSIIASTAPTQERISRKVKMIITAYSSTVWETDEDPFTTAAGTQVRDGIVANNLLPFGTKIRVPELYGNKVFVVEDRMNWRKSDYHLDIWFPEYRQALNFGAQLAYVEILEK
jgi:3D (Asp-Asp-Asp) domain-containing protein